MSQQEHEALLGSHELSFMTDTRRMVTVALWGIVVGAVFTVFSVAFMVRIAAGAANTSSGDAGFWEGLMIAVALLLPLSAVRLVRGLRLRGESYLLYQDGFVYHSPARDEVVRWSDVVAVREAGKARTGGLYHALALDYWCRIRCSDGRKFRLSTYTDDADWFARSVSRHVSESKAAQS